MEVEKGVGSNSRRRTPPKMVAVEKLPTSSGEGERPFNHNPLTMKELLYRFIIPAKRPKLDMVPPHTSELSTLIEL